MKYETQCEDERNLKVLYKVLRRELTSELNKGGKWLLILTAINRQVTEGVKIDVQINLTTTKVL